MERNRIKGRPGGRGRGGGSGGRVGGGGGGGRSNHTKRSGPDPSTLGDNAFRFERNRQKDNTDGNSDQHDHGGIMLLDDFNTGLLLGSDYYGASHYDVQEDNYEGGDTATSLLYQQKKTTTSSSSRENSDNDWMSIDIQAMSDCLKQLPIHGRLDVPYHVGKHIESRYGGGGGAGKKTLAELREESKCIVKSDNYDVTSMKRSSVEDVPKVEEEAVTNKSTSKTKEPKAGDNDDDEDDLDAWLDDMIS